MQGFYGNTQPEGGVFGQGAQEKIFSKAPNLTTSEIKQIVDGLNRPPFMANLSLVEFDDKAPLELLELLNKVLGHFDEQHKSVDI
jgi:hypothetical protein